MSFITKEHANPGKVTKRLNGWSEIIYKNNQIISIVKKRLDERQKEISAAAPVLIGKLKGSIKVYTGDDVATLGVGVYYAIYVHLGKPSGGSRRPNPFWSNHIAGLSMQLIVDVRDLFASRW
jgi:hypothetical protein